MACCYDAQRRSYAMRTKSQEPPEGFGRDEISLALKRSHHSSLASATCSAATLQRAIAALDNKICENELRLIGAGDEQRKKNIEIIHADQAALDELKILKRQNE